MFAIFQCGVGGGHGRFEVGHGDGAPELFGDVGEDVGRGGSVAEVMVEVIGEGDGEFGALGNRCHGGDDFIRADDGCKLDIR